MAQTKAKKLQKRLLREGRYDVTNRRGGQAVEISTLTRRTKSKTETLEAKRRKYKKLGDI
ncbi:hypothetical protein [Rossellomorea marisflavi]|uniref:hypothetical protein n=1 Tax=Rossellomorea marisflavi TaxID=189381 RepID=UPI003F9F647C